jgi:hypothetical protein
VIFLDHFEYVAVGAAEKEPLEGRFADRLDQGGSVNPQPLLQHGKLSTRVSDRNVSAEFPLEWRRLELGILNQMQLASWCDFEPRNSYRDIARPLNAPPTENISEEPG